MRKGEWLDIDQRETIRNVSSKGKDPVGYGEKNGSWGDGAELYAEQKE